MLRPCLSIGFRRLFTNIIVDGCLCQHRTKTTVYQTQEKPLTKQEITEITERIPIEKKSLTRGLSLNKFEKDFIVYPEYEESKDLEKIKVIVGELTIELEKRILQAEAPNGTLPKAVHQLLIDKGIFASTIPKEYGGIEHGQKDMLQIAESMGNVDLSTFNTFNQILMISKLISQFGSEEQKQRYLAGIAIGKWRPAICWQEDTAGVEPTIQVLAAQGQELRLCANKVNVVNAMDANMFIVFANKKIGNAIRPLCYIVERDAIDSSISSIQIKDEIISSGLQHCNFSTVVFDNVLISDGQLIGDDEDATLLAEEMAFSSKSLYGAAVVGYLKKVLNELCTFANMEVRGNLRLSDSHPVQKEIFDLGIQTYVLESMAYYTGGLTDEGLFLIQDIENSIIQRYANKVMHQAIKTITEVAGLSTLDNELPYDRMIKDSIGLMAQSEPDLHLVRRITIPTIEAYINHYGGLRSFMKTTTISKLLSPEPNLEEFMHPKLVHFIAEHAHPSLHHAAQNFEYSLARMHKVIDILTTDQGIYLNTDYDSLQKLSTLIENNLAMVTTIARTSRSYSIGVRNSDIELAWTNFFCMQAGNESRRIITDIIEQSGRTLYAVSPNLTIGAKNLLDANGYCLESPLEKNW